LRQLWPIGGSRVLRCTTARWPCEFHHIHR
jgi:hypothetical protein